MHDARVAHLRSVQVQRIDSAVVCQMREAKVASLRIVEVQPTQAGQRAKVNQVAIAGGGGPSVVP
ncbi:MAG: hypothetical protein WD847_03320 [Pirellulales bacterium]